MDESAATLARPEILREPVTSGAFEQLNEGQRVSFDEEPSPKGPRAGNVRGEG